MDRDGRKGRSGLARALGLALGLLAVATAGGARPAGAEPPFRPLGPGPWTYDVPGARIRVVVVARGLEHPWSIAFLPDGALLVTERPGRLRIIRDGVLDPTPISGVPPVYALFRNGLMDVALHPGFRENRWVYLAYSKPGTELPRGVVPLGDRLPTLFKHGMGRTTTNAIARGRFDGHALTDVEEIFVAENWVDDSISETSGSRLLFAPDGTLFVTIGAPNAPGAPGGRYARARGGRAQEPGSHGGKVLRLRDDGSAPPDNPFVGRTDTLPEIYTLGHRDPLGLAFQPGTGRLFEHENGPRDGDEVNVLVPGANYGWPLVGMGRDYSGDWIGGPEAIGARASVPGHRNMYLPGMMQPVLFWVPAVAPSGMTFYSGTAFPGWHGDLFIGHLKGRILERYRIRSDRPASREELLGDLGQRIRDVRQGPDGLLYVLTDERDGAVLRIEPAPADGG